MNSNICNCRLEQAAEDPSALTQETIIEKLDPVEAARLDKVRNIGIAVQIHRGSPVSHYGN